MKSTHYVSPPFTSEGDALASVEAIMAEGGHGKKGKSRIINKNAYEAGGVWIAEITVEDEEELDEEIGEELHLSAAREPNPNANELDTYAFMNAVAPLRPLEVEMPALSLEPSSMPEENFSSIHNSELGVVLNHDFVTAETEHGKIPVLEEVLDLAVQEELAHEARIAQEYTALRHKILIEELATLTPSKPDNDDLKPEPGVTA